MLHAAHQVECGNGMLLFNKPGANVLTGHRPKTLFIRRQLFNRRQSLCTPGSAAQTGIHHARMYGQDTAQLSLQRHLFNWRQSLCTPGSAAQTGIHRYHLRSCCESGRQSEHPGVLSSMVPSMCPHLPAQSAAVRTSHCCRLLLPPGCRCLQLA
jgi:hypothetical protein